MSNASEIAQSNVLAERIPDTIQFLSDGTELGGIIRS